MKNGATGARRTGSTSAPFEGKDSWAGIRYPPPMAESCIFCKIVAGEIPAQVVYKDEHTCVFLDNDPLAKGHALVVPVRHHTRLEALSQAEAEKHLGTLPRIVNAVTDVTEADGATVAWNNGPAAGQEVPHLHAHIVPRTDHDDHGPVHSMFQNRPELSDTENHQIAERLKLALNETPIRGD